MSAVVKSGCAFGVQQPDGVHCDGVPSIAQLLPWLKQLNAVLEAAQKLPGKLLTTASPS